MPPHNNRVELEMRNTTVLPWNTRSHPPTAEGRSFFSILVSTERIYHKPGIFPRAAVKCLIKDPDWELFR